MNCPTVSRTRQRSLGSVRPETLLRGAARARSGFGVTQPELGCRTGLSREAISFCENGPRVNGWEAIRPIEDLLLDVVEFESRIDYRRRKHPSIRCSLPRNPHLASGVQVGYHPCQIFRCSAIAWLQPSNRNVS